MLSLDHLMFAVDVIEALSVHAPPLLPYLAHSLLPKREPQMCVSPQLVAQQECQHPMEWLACRPKKGWGLPTGGLLRSHAACDRRS